MNVRLITATPNGEDIIAYCARATSPERQGDPAPRLLRYCVNHKHWSVFEQADMTVEIITSRAISAQMLRHHSFRFQEFSQRYAAVQEVEVYPVRLQDAKNRQSSHETDDEALQAWWRDTQQQHTHDTMALYNEALERGVAREIARFLLPMAARTRLYMKGNTRDWIFYILTRTGQDTQKEHREIAEAVKTVFVEQFPIVSEALGWRE